MLDTFVSVCLNYCKLLTLQRQGFRLAVELNFLSLTDFFQYRDEDPGNLPHSLASFPLTSSAAPISDPSTVGKKLIDPTQK